jgi:hypothetical protein
MAYAARTQDDYERLGRVKRKATGTREH